MMANEAKEFGWAAVVAALIGFGTVVGLALGLVGSAGLLPSGAIPGLIGVICGFAAPLLVVRMRAVRRGNQGL